MATRYTNRRDGYSTGHSAPATTASGYSAPHADYGYTTIMEEQECCPLVVDPLTLIALIGFIAAATAFLNIQITMILTGKRRKRGASTYLSQASSFEQMISDTILESITEVMNAPHNEGRKRSRHYRQQKGGGSQCFGNRLIPVSHWSV